MLVYTYEKLRLLLYLGSCVMAVLPKPPPWELLRHRTQQPAPSRALCTTIVTNSSARKRFWGGYAYTYAPVAYLEQERWPFQEQ